MQSNTTEHVSELEQAKRALRAKLIARDEALVRAFGAVLAGIREDTRANVERKASLTEREREEEAEQVAAEQEEALLTGGMGYVVQDEEEGDNSDRVYNPLKLPLGWDGKPIPYWLYKMQGLAIGYSCEICSDHVYHGLLNFEKHFQESRHSFGMRALGLPNTIEFRDVTRIKDAFARTLLLTVAEKLRRENKLEAEDEADMEEIEDEHGNVCTHH